MHFGKAVTGYLIATFQILLSLLLSTFMTSAQEGSSIPQQHKKADTISNNLKYWDANTPFHLVYPEKQKDLEITSIVKYIGEGWFIINTQKPLKPAPFFEKLRYVLPANNNWKLSTSLFEKVSQHKLHFPATFRVWLAENSKLDIHFIRKEILESYPVAIIRIENMKDWNLLLQQQNVLAVEEVITGRIAKPESSIERYDPATNLVNFAHRSFGEIAGRGKVVSIKERRFDTTDIDFRNRYFLTSVTAPQQDGHATEMATLAAGSGNTGIKGKGVAWQSTLTSASFENLMPEPPSYYTTHRISVQNHSYGTGIENEYAIDAAAYDHLMWNDSSLLHVFSAGNRGTQTPTTGNYAGVPGFNNLTGSFKMSKNSLSIGASNALYKIESLSSKGPAYDGRIKPELAAFGIDGTSGSAALTSGTALLLQQALHNSLGYHPPAALVKALIIGSAKDTDAPGPDYASGYGHLDAFNALSLAQKKQYILGTTTSGATNNYTISIPPNVRGLKITLHWTDTAATPGTAKSLVNDLDLVVNDPGNQAWLPWILSTFPHIDSLQQPAFRGTDHINNTEQVFIPNPAQGIYQIKVTPYGLATSTQRFALAYDIQYADDFVCTYPTTNDPVTAGENAIIRWNQSFESGKSVAIDYAVQGSLTYQPITTSTNAETGYFSWLAPVINAVIKLRFTIEGKVYYSDSIFVSKPLQVKPGYVCNDSVLLFWKPLEGIARYNVYAMGDTLMQLAGSTSDTLIKLPATAVKSAWVSVSAISPAPAYIEAIGGSFNINQQGVGCYFKSFLAEWDNNMAVLRISLGTTYHLQSVNIQKISNGIFQHLISFSPVNATDYNYNDIGLTPGAHTYRVILIKADGREIMSETQTIIQPNVSGWWVYPNPVNRGGRLQIINRWSETDDLYLDIFDINGRKVKTMIIPLIDNSISVANLNAGIYFMVFSDGKKRIGHQKLIILP